MDERIKNVSKDIWNKLKNTVNASVDCKYDDKADKLNVEISRLGLIYKTSIKDFSSKCTDETDIEIAFDKVVKSYRQYVEHKFFN